MCHKNCSGRYFLSMSMAFLGYEMIDSPPGPVSYSQALQIAYAVCQRAVPNAIRDPLTMRCCLKIVAPDLAIRVELAPFIKS
jgi:hypothetical protein